MPNPELIALLTSDAIAVDPNGKVTLYGVFDVIYAPQFPTRHGQLAIYCKCRFSTPGEAHVELRAPDGRVIVSVDPMRVEHAGIAQGVYVLAGLEFPEAGTYNLALVGAEGSVGDGALEARVRQ